VFSQADTIHWKKAEVPGAVHLDLMKNGITEDPFYRMNEHDQQWIDKKDWVYKTIFSVHENLWNKPRIHLCFEGLDTYADVYLNDSLILEAENMHLGYTINCKSLLKKNNNELKIYFHSPVKKGLALYEANNLIIPVSDNDQSELGGLGNKQVSVYTRKAGYHYGWDWGPRLVTSGIYRPVYLEGLNSVYIDDLYVHTKEIHESKAIMTGQLVLKGDIRQDDLTVLISANGKTIETINLSPEMGEIADFSFIVENPELWFPNGMGEPAMYEFVCELRQNNNTLSRDTLNTGIRTIEMVAEDDSIGRSFYFIVNGEPLFMKGVNYIPQDIFLARVADDQYEFLIRSAVESGMNMIRVWGGGVYEKQLFYNLCDQHGLLVWQDFMFACAMYPGSPDFYNNVALEAEYQVKRLRKHPSIALWCGNNEGLAAWYQWGWKDKVIEEQGQDIADTLWSHYQQLFHQLLPATVERYSDLDYWSSSPSADFGATANYQAGNVHYWSVWWGQKPFETYNEAVGRFMSEYGFQSFPQWSTIEKFTEEEDLDIFSDVMQSHQKSSIGNGTIENYQQIYYQAPKDFKSYLYLSQIMQAEGLKIAFEAHRRNKPYCMGSLYWQLNDCWPVASWASIDYYGNWKGLMYQAKRSFKPFLVNPYSENDTVKIYVVSDRLDTVSGILTYRLLSFSGKEIMNHTQRVKLSNNQSILATQIPQTELLSNLNPSCHVLITELTVREEKYSNHLYFEKPKNLNLEKAVVDVALNELGDGAYRLNLKTPYLLKNVKISVRGQEQITYSDNYFDLLPDRSKIIMMQAEDAINKEDILIKSLVDTYQ